MQTFSPVTSYKGLSNTNWQASPQQTGSEQIPESMHGNTVSAVGAGMNMALADSSVRFLAYDVELDIFKRLGCRADGLPLYGQSGGL